MSMTTHPKSTFSMTGLFPTFARPTEIKARAERKGNRGIQAITHYGPQLPKAYLTLINPRHTFKGLGVATIEGFRFFTDADGRAMKLNAKHQADNAVYLQTRAAHREDWKGRVTAAVISASAIGGGVVTLNVTDPILIGVHLADVLTMAAVGGIPAALGLIGKPKDLAVVTPVVYSGHAFELSNDLILDALSNLGIVSLRKAIEANRKEAVRFRDMGTTRGEGIWISRFDLPAGIIASDISNNFDTFVGNLNGPKRDQVGITEGDKPNQVLLTVLDHSASESSQPTAQLLGFPEIDLFEPFVIGHDQLMKPIFTARAIMGSNILIGGVPESGKSVTLINHCSAVALDPRAKFAGLYDLKGFGDLDPFMPLAQRRGVIEVDENGKSNRREVLQSCLNGLRDLKTEVHRRGTIVRKHARTSKVTSKVASEIPELTPLVFVIDEIQELLLDDEFGTEANEILERLTYLDRAAAVSVIVTTQNPTAKTLPGNLRKNLTVRYCHRVMDYETNDRILPDGSWSANIKATTIPASAPGTVIMATSTADAKRFRVSFLSPDDANSIAEFSIERRCGEVTEVVDAPPAIALGPVSGETIVYASEGTTSTTDLQWRADILTVAEGEEKLQSQQIVERLQQAFPGRYDGIVAATVTDILRSHEVPTEPDVHKKNTIDPKTGQTKPSTRTGVVIEEIRSNWK